MATLKGGASTIFAAKVIFMIAGYALYIGLGRLLTVERFGVYGVLFGIVSLINMVVVNGTMQTISRFVAAQPERAAAIRRRGFLYQTGFASVLLAAYLLAAPALGDFFHDPELVPLLRASALITGIYAFYAVNVGFLNGRQQFGRQASLDITFSVLKVSFILVLVGLGFGLHGVVFGFAAAAFCVLLVSFGLSGVSFRGDGSGLSAREFVGYGASVMVGALLLNGVLNADLLILKHAAAGGGANTMAGHYTAAQSIARIPYALMVTVTLVLFPFIASLSKDDDATRERRREATSRAMSMILTLLTGMVAVITPVATSVVLVLYPAPFAAAGSLLAVLVAAMCLLTLLSVATTIISGAGRPTASAALLGITLIAQAVAAFLWIPRHGALGAAMATLLATAIGFGLAMAFLNRAYGTRIRLWSLGVTAAAAGVIAALGITVQEHVTDAGKLTTVAYCAGAYGLYLALCAAGGALLGAPASSARVLWVTKPLDPPFNDGAKTLPRALLEHVDPAQIAICVSRTPAAGEWPHDLEVVRVYSTANSFVARVLQNARVFGYLLLARFHYRALHFFFAPNPTTCTAIRALKAVTPGVTFVQTIMSRPRSFEGSSKLLFGDIVVAQSEETRRELAAASGRSDIQLLRPSVTRVAELVPRPPNELGPTLLFAGDIDHGGALSHLAVVVPALLRAHTTMRFVFSVRVKGPQTLKHAEAFFEEHLSPFASRAEMLVDHPDFEQLLTSQDAMIFPAEDLYTKVDAPLVILETMARGKPVFLLDRAPLNEIPSDTLRSALVARDDEEMIEQVLAFLREPSSISPDSLRDAVTARFSAERAACALMSIYKLR